MPDATSGAIPCNMERLGLAENGADEAGRLEAALDRIAHAARRANGQAHSREHAEPSPGAADSGIDVRALAARLDALIEELRGILGQA